MTSINTVVGLAEWACYCNIDEIFDACGEIFDKQQFEVDSTSRFGRRLIFYACIKALDRLIGSYNEAILGELLDYITELEEQFDLGRNLNFFAIKSDILYQVSLCSILTALNIHNHQPTTVHTNDPDLSDTCKMIRSRILTILESIEDIFHDNDGDPQVESFVTSWQGLVDCCPPKCTLEQAVRKAKQLQDTHNIPSFVTKTKTLLKSLENELLESPALEISFSFTKSSHTLPTYQPTTSPSKATSDWSLTQRHEHGPYSTLTSSMKTSKTHSIASGSGARDEAAGTPIRIRPANLDPGSASHLKSHLQSESSGWSLSPTQSQYFSQSVLPSPVMPPRDLLHAKAINAHDNTHTRDRRDMNDAQFEDDDFNNVDDGIVAGEDDDDGDRIHDDAASESTSSQIQNSTSRKSIRQSRVIEVDSDEESKIPVVAAGAPLPHAKEKPRTAAAASSNSSRKVVAPSSSSSAVGSFEDNEDDGDKGALWFAKRRKLDLVANKPSASRLVPDIDSDDDVLTKNFSNARDHQRTKSDWSKSGYKPRSRWTDEEEQALREGFDMYGSRWADIKLDPRFAKLLRSRTNINLKDKARQLQLSYA